MKNAREYKKSQAEAAREQHNTILEVPLEPGQPVSAKFFFLKLIYSEKATKFCEISTVDLYWEVMVKSTVEIL